MKEGLLPPSGHWLVGRGQDLGHPPTVNLEGCPLPAISRPLNYNRSSHLLKGLNSCRGWRPLLEDGSALLEPALLEDGPAM